MPSSAKTPALTLVGLCLSGLVAIHPAAAQELTCTLSGVTFNDGAVASGYFDYNPMTQTFGNFDITTSNGVTDTIPGSHYIPNPDAPVNIYSTVFYFRTGLFDINTLALATTTPITSADTYALRPGGLGYGGGFSNSGENTAANLVRVVTGGSLVTTVPGGAPVPEASTTVSFGLLLALGMGVVVVAAKNKKTVPSA